jgi:prepilin-type N-terminal cleavage/methylation domain-containing protein
MLSLVRKRMKGGKGFTLIELLVVIIIIAILAAIAIPTFLGQRQKAQDAAAKSLVRNAMTAIESAYVDTRAFDLITDADLAAIEPSIEFLTVAGAGSLAPADPAAAGTDAQANEVGWDGIDEANYGVGSQSQSGRTFSVLVDKGADGGNTFYIDGAAADW